MRRHLCFALLLLTSCAAPLAPEPDGQEQRQSAAEVVDDRELIALAAGLEVQTVARARALGYEPTATHPLPALDDILIVFRIPADRSIAEAIEEVEAASPGITAGAHHLYRLQTDGDTAAAPGRFYANALIGWPSDGCPAVRSIGMIDAGVPAIHPGLADGSIVQQQFFDGDAPPATNHGAQMADLLVGPGRLRAATLYSANVIDPTLEGGDAAGVVAILRAVDWLRAHGVDIVNVSLAGPRNRLLDRGLGHAAASDMIMVAAAGNDGPAAPPLYPAAFPFVLAVTAVDRDLDVYTQAVQGDHIDLAAPGVDLLLESEGGLQIVSGTSAAAPFVTAAIAAAPDLSELDIEGIRDRLAAQAQDLGATGNDPVFGAGLIAAPANCR